MDVVTIVIGALIILSVWLLWHLTHTRGHLETLGIPIDKPVGLLGTGPHNLHNHVLHKIILERFKQFGTKTYGKYDGVVPVIVTMDPEIIKSVMVRNFDNFIDIFPKQEDKHTTLDLSTGETWKVLRKNLSPTFTSGKLKSMLEPMSEVADKTMDFLEQHLKQSMDNEIMIKEVLQGFSLNVIGRSAFGINVDAHKNPDHDFVKQGQAFMDGFMGGNRWFFTFMTHVVNYFPYIEDKVPFWPPAFNDIWTTVKAIMAERTKKGVKLNDFLDRLLEMQKKLEENKHEGGMEHLSEDMIVAQGVIFLVAGFETTASTMATTCYHLSKNPEVQERLYNEIEEVFEQYDGNIDHETIKEMNYLEAVINEDLRIDGPGTSHFRMCSKDTEVVPGMTVKKGMRVEMPLYACHHNEEYFPEPEEFRPERFLKENAKDLVPYTFRPFGGGPRQCIGQRFSMVQMKLMLAKLLHKYRLVATENTKLEHYKGVPLILAFDDIRIKLEQRVEE